MDVDSEAGKIPSDARVGEIARLPTNTPAERDLDAVYHRIHRRAFDAARQIVDRDTAEDIVHDVLFAFFRNWDKLPLEKKSDALIVAAVCNTALNRHKREERLVDFDEDLHSVSPLAIPPTSEAAGGIVDHEILDSIVAKMPPQARAVYVMWRQEYSYDEIAAALDIKNRTVARHVQEATQYLKKGIERYGLRMARETALEIAQRTRLQILRTAAHRALPRGAGEPTDG